MPAQQGVMSAYQLMGHTHTGVGQGGRLSWRNALTDKPVFDVKEYGALCNGVYDDSIAIQAAHDALPAEGGEIFFPEDDYYPQSQVNITKDNVVINFGSARIHWAESTAGTPYTYLIEVSGGVGASTLLNVNADKGDQVIDVVDASIFSIDDYVIIRSESAPGTYKIGEIHRIMAVDEILDTITIVGGLWEDYLVADTCTIEIRTMVRNLKIKNGYIIGGFTPEQVTFAMAFQIEQAVDFAIENVSIKNVCAIAVHLQDCLDGEVKGCKIEGSAKATLGYAVQTSAACSDLNIHHNDFYYCRHHFAGGGWAGYGTPKNINVHHNTFTYTSTNTAAVDMHTCAGYNIKVDDNIFNQCEYAIGLGSISWSAKRNIIFNAKYGIFDKDDLSEDVVINDNQFYGYGIFIWLDSPVLKNVVIADNNGRDCETGVIIQGNVDLDLRFVDNDILESDPGGATGADAWYQQRLYVDTARKVLISNNQLEDGDRSGLYLTDIASGEILGNDIRNCNQDGNAGANYGSGMYIVNSSHLNIIGNNCYDDQGGGATQKYGYSIDNTNNNILFEKNQAWGNTTLDFNNSFIASTELTIAAGVITVTKPYHRVDGQGDAADILLTINGGYDKMELTLVAENVARVITVQEGGNIELEGGVQATLGTTLQKLYLLYDAISAKWVERSRFTG